MSEGLTAAVDAVAAAVLELRGRSPDAEVRGLGVERITLDDEAMAQLHGHRLPAVVAEFLRAHSSHDFVDAGLRCGARAAWISAATSVRELTALYADTPGWRRDWLVCALDESGCYVLDLTPPVGDDCPVLYVTGEGAVHPIAPGFVAFLRLVARDSRPEDAVLADRSRGARPPPGLARAQRRDAAAGAVVREDRGSYVVPVLFALFAAALLWWLR